MAGLIGLIKGAGRLAWGGAKVGAGVAVEKKIEDLLFGSSDEKKGVGRHILGATASGFGSLGKMAAKKMVQQAATPKHKTVGGPKAAHEATETTRHTGNAVQVSLRTAARMATRDFSKAVEAMTALDDSVVGKLEDLSDLFDRLAYKMKGAGGQGGGGPATGGEDDGGKGGGDDKKDPGFSWRDFLLGRMSKGRAGGAAKAGEKVSRFRKIMGKAGRFGGGALRWGGRALGAAGAGLAGYDQFSESQEKGEGLATSIGKGAVVGGGTAAGGYIGAIIGQAVIPIPILGAGIGGLIGGYLGGMIAKYFVNSPDMVSLGADLATLSFEVEKDITFDIEGDIVFEAPVIIMGGGVGGGGDGSGATTPAAGPNAIAENSGQTSPGLSFEDQQMASSTTPGGESGGHKGGGHKGGGGEKGGTADEGKATGPAYGTYKEVRARYEKELQEDPGLRDSLKRLMAAEIGDQGPKAAQMFVESIMNRAARYGKKLRSMLTGAYYEPLRHGTGKSYGSKLSDQYDEAIKGGLGGSNLSHGATGNASESPAFGSKGMFGQGVGKGTIIDLGPGKEKFGEEAGTEKWRAEMERRAREEDQRRQQQPQAQTPQAPAAPESGVRNGRIVINPSTPSDQMTPYQEDPPASAQPTPPARPVNPTDFVPPQNKSDDKRSEDTSRKMSSNQGTKTTSSSDKQSGGDDTESRQSSRVAFSEHLNTKAA